jgi:hypothetical protein
MATFYMSESHPSFIMAEMSPGPGWTPAERSDAHSGHQDATTALSDDPQATFEALAKQAAATLNISLSGSQQGASLCRSLISGPTLESKI